MRRVWRVVVLCAVAAVGCKGYGETGEIEVQQPPPQPPPVERDEAPVEPPPPPLATPLPAGTDPAEQDARVFFFEPFEDPRFLNRFSTWDRKPNMSLVTGTAFMGRTSLRVLYPAGRHYGCSLRYEFKKLGREEPEELYARYYLRFDPGFDARGGGKLPGPAGTYGKAGWGDRESNGRNGWSARMTFAPAWRGSIQLEYYVYQTGNGIWGEHMRWNIGDRGRLQTGRWYCVESHVKLNTPGKRDGVLRGWVDGRLACDRRDLNFRLVPQLKIEEFWINHYFGGTATSPKRQGVQMDNFALSTHRIGPVR